MEKTKQQLEANLAQIKLGLNNPKITNNKGLLSSLNKRIANAQAELDNYKEDKESKKSDAKQAAIKKLLAAGYSENDADDFAEEWYQGGVKLPAKAKAVIEAKVKATKPVKVVKEKSVKVKKEKVVKEVAAPISKKETQELKSSPKVAKVLASEFKRHRTHYELSKVGLSKLEISAITGATHSNIGRDLLFYKNGKLTVN